ncbi:hypothetical protein AMJ85_06715 [candidate division BRC1 bacterium SM23_51]|nr:MAG: hypothetical protein AMJ85_06715 [candidate division BRC1 bacterium SM23_51]
MGFAQREPKAESNLRACRLRVKVIAVLDESANECSSRPQIRTTVGETQPRLLILRDGEML